MNTVVTWWEGETKRHLINKDEASALAVAHTLRMRSDAYADRSLVPIRVMPLGVYEHMQKLEKARDETRCRHGLLRLCLKCLTG